MKARCPKDESHDQFVTVATVIEKWIVNRYGGFIQVESSGRTIHGPDVDNCWTCVICGSEAKVTED